MNLKKRCIIASALLLAGAIASTMLAWTVSVCSGPGYDGEYCTDVATIKIGQSRVSGLRIRTLAHEEWWQWIGEQYPEFARPKDIRPPSWARPPEGTAPLDRCTAAFGFPMLCLKSEFGLDKSGARWDRYSIEWDLSLRSAPAELPLAPLWLGLVIDSLFYAALVPLTWTTFRLVRRLIRRHYEHIRMRRGHCPHCNYDLLHNFSHPCPECGHTAVRM